ncbi:MAG: hypothetical protein RR744_00070 [Cellulosilyticaceae bacterium]
MAKKTVNEDGVLASIDNLKNLSGKRTISVVIKDNGKEDRENPAYYGALHDSRDYPFSEESLKEWSSDILSDSRINKKLLDIAKNTNIRRKTSDLDDIAEIIGTIGVESVLNYILYEMPQKPQPWKKSGLPNLVETGTLLDSIEAKIKRKGKEWGVK